MGSTRRVPDALGQSEAFLEFQQRLSKAAKVDRPVLILGERGVGKELVANRLHFLSARWDRPLITLNCAALTETLIESELFGHESGAFTGAQRRREGRFEMADGGTLFLDEIGLIPMVVQEKILRVVEYGSFERVGGAESIGVDVRIIGAANVNLAALARQGKFKADLLDRLSFEALHVPPLREREEDIQLLAFHFAARMANELGYKKTPEFSESAMAALESHHWPGNVRELKNVVERAVYRHEGDRISRVELDPFESPYAPEPEMEPNEHTETPTQPPPQPQGKTERTWDFPIDLRQTIADLEAEALEGALKLAQYRQKEAAEALGLSYHQFRSLYRKRFPQKATD